MKKFTYNKVLLLAIALGLVASLLISFQRHHVERANYQVDMAVDYESLWNLAERDGLDFPQVLIAAKNAGITSLAIYETTLEKLSRTGKLSVLSGYELLTAYNSGTLSDFNWRLLVETGQIDAGRIYITPIDPAVYLQVKEDLIRRVGAQRVTVLNSGENFSSRPPTQVNAELGMRNAELGVTGEVLEVKAQYGPFMTEKLGILTEQLDTAKNFGFSILARPSNYLKCSPDDVRATFARLDGYPISAIVFDGQQVLGAPDQVALTAQEMQRHSYTLGLIEHTTQLQFYNQAGLLDLARLLGYDHCARLYAIPKDEQPKLEMSTAINRWATTDHERNIRINLLRIYDKPLQNLSLFETNIKYFSETTDLLREKGYSFGPASTFDSFYPSRLLRALVMLGVAAAITLYLSLVSKRLNSNPRLQLLLFAALVLTMSIPVLIGAGAKVRLLAALASANIFPALAIIWQLDSIRFMRLRQHLKFRKLKGSNRTEAVLEQTSILQIVILAFLALLLTGAMSMVGAAYLSGSLSDVEYFLEVQIFRGIKLTFVLPLVLVAIAFLQRFNVVEAFEGQGARGEGQGARGSSSSSAAAAENFSSFSGDPPTHPQSSRIGPQSDSPPTQESQKFSSSRLPYGLGAQKSLGFLNQLKLILDMPVKVKAFLAFLIVAVAFVVLIARSGHTAGMPVSGAEIKLRAMLENFFYARPRSKEVFLGHPAFMLAIMAFFKRWPVSIFFVLVEVAVLGQSSMVETFAHMRTPVFMSFMRGLDGLLLGGLLGVLPMLAIHLASSYFVPSAFLRARK